MLVAGSERGLGNLKGPRKAGLGYLSQKRRGAVRGGDEGGREREREAQGRLTTRAGAGRPLLYCLIGPLQLGRGRSSWCSRLFAVGADSAGL